MKTFKKVTLLKVIVVCLFILAGCQSRGCQPKPVAVNAPPNEQIRQVQQDNGEAVANQHKAADLIINHAEGQKTSVGLIEKSVENIDTATNNSLRLDTDAIRNETAKINVGADAIKTEANNIKAQADVIDTGNKKLEEAAIDVDALYAEIEVLKNEKTQLQNEAIKRLYGQLTAFFGLGFVTVLAGAVTMIYNRKMGLLIAGIGVLTIAFAAAATFFLKSVAIVGAIILGLGALGGLGVLAYTLYRARGHGKALEETVELVEAVKQELPPEKKVEVFGDGAKPGYAQKIQTTKTQETVRRIREEKLAPKIQPTLQR